NSGGTGAAAFTQYSVPFIGASGVYAQDNAYFYYDSVNHRLAIGPNGGTGPTTRMVIGSINNAVAAPSQLYLGEYNNSGAVIPTWISNWNSTGTWGMSAFTTTNDHTVYISNIDTPISTSSVWSSTKTLILRAPNMTAETAMNVGVAGASTGLLGVSGVTSGTITIQPQSAAGTYNFNLPTTAGTSGQLLTSGGGGSAADTWSSPAVVVWATSTAYVAGNVITYGSN